MPPFCYIKAGSIWASFFSWIVVYVSSIYNWKKGTLMDLINIKSPADLKGLSISELTDLTAQAR